MKRNDWTAGEDATLTRLWRSGATLTAIMFHIDRTKNAIKKRRIALGLPVRREKLAAHMLRINVNKEMHAKIKARADARGTTVAAYLRYIVLRDCGVIS